MKLPIAILALAAPSNAFAPSAHPSLPTSLSAVSKKDTYQITLLPGDGIGPEIMSSCKDVLGALQKRCGFTLEMKEALIGGVAIDEAGDPFPDESLEQCLKSDSVLLSCIGGYKVIITFDCCYLLLLLSIPLSSNSCFVMRSGIRIPVNFVPKQVYLKCVNPWDYLPIFVLPRFCLSLLMPPL
jgi:hypothetical protein